MKQSQIKGQIKLTCYTDVVRTYDAA